MKSYPQPEGEDVSDAQDGQEGTSELSPKGKKKRVEAGWGWGRRKSKKELSAERKFKPEGLGFISLALAPQGAEI